MIGLFLLFAKEEKKEKEIKQYLGFGLVTDITLDAYRNFRGWSEDEDVWVLRWRMRVLWLDSTVEDLLLKASDDRDFENELKDRLKKGNLKLTKKDISLGGDSNLCYEEKESVKEVWDKLKQIISDSREVERIVKLYSEVVKREVCTPRALDASSYNKAMDEVRKELYLNDDTAQLWSLSLNLRSGTRAPSSAAAWR